MFEPDSSPVRDLLKIVGLFVVPALAAVMGVAWVAQTFFAPKPYDGARLQAGVTYVSSRQFETAGLQSLSDDGRRITLSAWDAVARQSLQPRVVVLVHGYNAREEKVGTYFADFVTGLREHARFGGSFLVFDWPSLAVPFDELPTSTRLQYEMRRPQGANQPAYELTVYGIDRRQALTVGAPSFAALLDDLAAAKVTRIDVVAHSMGCLVVAAAMQKDPGLLARVHSLVWLAPDVDAAAVAEPWFRAAVASLKGGLAVLHSRNDRLLALHARFANGASRLGAGGPPDGAAVPPRVTFSDLTEQLGKENVHGAYLARTGPALDLVMAVLAAR